MKRRELGVKRRKSIYTEGWRVQGVNNQIIP